MFVNWDEALLLSGIFAGVLSTIAFAPYIIDTLRGRTHPQRACWLIWSVLGAISFFSQVYEGATASLWFAGVQVSGTIVVCLLSVRNGIGAYISTIDVYVLGAAAFGVVLWYTTETSAYALAISIGISLLGGCLTAAKAYKDPESETLSTWVVSLVASIFAIIAIGSFNPILLAYPVYLFTLYALFIGAILFGRKRYGRWSETDLSETFENVVAGIPVGHEANRALEPADRLNGIRPDNSIDT